MYRPAVFLWTSFPPAQTAQTAWQTSLKKTSQYSINPVTITMLLTKRLAMLCFFIAAQIAPSCPAHFNSIGCKEVPHVVLLYCCPDCPSCPTHLNNIGLDTSSPAMTPDTMVANTGVLKRSLTYNRNRNTSPSELMA